MTIADKSAASTEPDEQIVADITGLIGATPLVELARYGANRSLRARLLGKAEFLNPAGSVKDRVAWSIIRHGEKSGELKPGDLIVDITSGNTGIALAAIAASRGYRTKFYLGDNTSPDKRRILEALGSELVVVPNSLFLDPEGVELLFARAEQENPEAFIANQLGNPANPEAHRETTGPEIWRDSAGGVDILVAGVGTGGTASGVGSYLKSLKPSVLVVIAEPGEGSIPSEVEVYPAEIDGVHKVADVEPDLLPPNYDADVVDEVVAVEAVDAYATSRALLREEGLLVGASAGAIVRVATQVASRPEHSGKTIVAVLPDTGERYLSTTIFTTVEESAR